MSLKKSDSQSISSPVAQRDSSDCSVYAQSAATRSARYSNNGKFKRASAELTAEDRRVCAQYGVRSIAVANSSDNEDDETEDDCSSDDNVVVQQRVSNTKEEQAESAVRNRASQS
jgi:hypothetical protein